MPTTRDRLRLHVDAALAKVPLHRDPGAARRDRHLLVVVAHAAAGSEGIAQPEAVARRDLVGDVGERGRALVGGHHQVGIRRRRGTPRRGGRDDRSLDHVVGQIEQALHEDPVAGHRLGLHRLAAGVGTQLLRHEAALGAHRHDHRVLHLLRLHQAQHLGAKVLRAVRPAQPAARDLAAAQVHARDARRVDPDLVFRHRARQVRQRGAVELEREPLLRLAMLVALEPVGAQRAADQRQIRAQHAVLVELLDALEIREDARRERLLGLAARRHVHAGRRIEARVKELHQRARDAEMTSQRLGDELLREVVAHLLHVMRVGAQDRDLAPAQARAHDQAVEAVALGAPREHVEEGGLHGRRHRGRRRRPRPAHRPG